MNVFNAENLSMSFGADQIFEDVDFGVDAGEKVGVVGPNGVGKTTLFRILIGDFVPDSGRVSFQQDARVGYLPQEPEYDLSETPRDIAERALRPVRDAITQFEELSRSTSNASPDELERLIDEQHELQQHIESHGGWNWQQRLEETFDRLGVTEVADTPLGGLSGGQRRRVALARVLLESPDLLLLDEPTNHLDPDMVEWLENWLHGYPGAVLVISHDRYFLDKTANRILEVTPVGIFDYPGNFAEYMERRQKRLEVLERTRERREKALEDELDWLERGVKARGRGSKKRADEIEKAREKLVDIVPEEITVEMSNGEPLGALILAARGLYKSYGDNQVLEDVSIMVAPGDKVGLVGPNGCGKSTLLKVLVGEERIDAGMIETGEQVQIAYLSQHGLEFDSNKNVYEAFSDSDYVWIGDERHHKRDYLGNYNFDRHDLKKKVKTLSGGQRRRLRIAKLMAENANVLVMDEPTNDLDLASLHALEEALRQFEGCIITVSHDRYFLNRVCNAIVAFEDERLERYYGDYDHYRSERIERARKRSEGATIAAAERSEAARDRAEARVETATASRTGLSYKEKKRLEALEEHLETLEDKKSAIQKELSDPQLYSSRSDEVASLNKELHALEDELESTWDEWAQLESRRDD
jgi:ATP-binding cassette subfamily F protein uup